MTLLHCLLLASAVFFLGLAGIFINRRNLIVILMSLELMFLAVNLNFIAFAKFLNNPNGEIFVFFTLTVAAAESAIGLAILLLLFRATSSLSTDNTHSLKG